MNLLFVKLSTVLPVYAWEGLEGHAELPSPAEAEAVHRARLERDEEDLRRAANRARADERAAIADLLHDGAATARELLLLGANPFVVAPSIHARVDGIVACEYLTALSVAAELKLPIDAVESHVRETVTRDLGIYRADLLAVTTLPAVAIGTRRAAHGQAELLTAAAALVADGLGRVQAAVESARSGQGLDPTDDGLRQLLGVNPFDVHAAIALAELLCCVGELEEARSILTTARGGGIACHQLALEECRQLIAAGFDAEASAFASATLQGLRFATSRWVPEVEAKQSLRRIADGS